MENSVKFNVEEKEIFLFVSGKTGVDCLKIEIHLRVCSGISGIEYINNITNVPEDFGNVCLYASFRSKYEHQDFLKPGLKISSTNAKRTTSERANSLPATSLGSNSIQMPVSAQHFIEAY